MDLICYLHPGWKPLIRPAESTREWMDGTPQAFAYRCLPLNIANAHGWEILTPYGFEVYWNGGTTVKDVAINVPAGASRDFVPVSLFGQGVLTFHVAGLFRTPPGWNIWVGGSPNRPKDGIFPLSGIIETDWAPYTFTMNWRFTRPGTWIRFAANEPFCFFFPIRRGYLEEVRPRFVAMDREPEVMRQFKAWSKSRDQFQAKVAKDMPAAAADRWQKRYYRGIDMDDRQPIEDHRSKLRLADFVPGEPGPPQGPAAAELRPAEPGSRPAAPAAPADTAPAQSPPSTGAGVPDTAAIQRQLQQVAAELMFGAPPEPLVSRLIALGAPEAEARRIIEQGQKDPLIVNGRQLATNLRKRDWLLEAMEKHWQLRPGSERIERRAGVSAEEFYERYYVPGRPVILLGEMADWPALEKWTPAYLEEHLGAQVIEFRDESAGGSAASSGAARGFELPFAQFVDSATRAGAAAYVSLSASHRNNGARERLERDFSYPDRILDRNAAHRLGALRIGSAGATSVLRHELSDSLLAQVVGRQRFKIAPAAEVGRLYNVDHVYSEIADLDSPEAASPRFAALRGARLYDIVLNPGEMIFLPVGWWHQAKPLDFSITATLVNFRQPGDWAAGYPAG